MKTIVRDAVDDWYLYGLVITETTLLTSFFEALERRIRHPFAQYRMFRNDRFLEVFREFISLKLTWPFRPQPNPSPCNYFFEDNRHPKPPLLLKYTERQKHPIRYRALFQELITRFQTENERHEAESLIDDLLDRLAAAIVSNRVGRCQGF
jgi:hypothetical protein